MLAFFISYTKSDREWAFWLAAELKERGHTPHIHEWEIKGGDDIYAWMEVHHDTAPALSAAFVGIRAYAELELLAGQSARLAANMRAALLRIRSVDLARPLASQELGAEVYEVATTMLHNIEGWSQLFGVKVVEAG